MDVSTREFGTRLGSFLRDVRRQRGLKVRHVAGHGLRWRDIRAIERGDYPLEPILVGELAGRYGAELNELLPPREPILVMATGTVAAGGLDEDYIPGDVDSLLDAYLSLIRRLRSANPDDAIVVRREDLIDIADQLQRPRPEIVDRVAVLLGATGSQRRAMVDLYLSGASVVGVAG